jgi:hypothetical protein
MNYNNIDECIDKQLRDVWMDVPEMTDKEVNDMLEYLYRVEQERLNGYLD